MFVFEPIANLDFVYRRLVHCRAHFHAAVDGGASRSQAQVRRGR
jgi:hypothetical protein